MIGTQDFFGKGPVYFQRLLLLQNAITARQQSSSMFESVLFLGSTQPRRTIFLFCPLTVHHFTPAAGFPNVFSFLIIFHSLTHPPTTCNPPSCFTHNFTQENCWVCSLLLPFLLLPCKAEPCSGQWLLLLLLPLNEWHLIAVSFSLKNTNFWLLPVLCFVIAIWAHKYFTFDFRLTDLKVVFSFISASKGTLVMHV